AQGLQINISWSLLNTLAKKMPTTYECFGVFRGDKISAICIAVNFTNEVAYYYLPGTSPMFRNQSPMVLLIAGMVDYYRKKGFRYLDLGLSSVQGQAQETLRLFKERMGAEETDKPTFIKSI
ncbi:MAG: GNAT family N-acetyltransferase, partial [Bacteroidota bacterium]